MTNETSQLEDVIANIDQEPASSYQPEQVQAGSDRNLDTILRIPVSVQVILGSAQMPVSQLMRLGRGSVVALDQRVGEPVNIVVNGRIVAKGEVVVVEEDSSRFGVTLTEVVSMPMNKERN